MAKEILQITISKAKIPKTKFGKWFYWKIYFNIWKIWRPRIMSKVYHTLFRVLLSLLPKEKREEILKEFEEIDVVIKNEINTKNG